MSGRGARGPNEEKTVVSYVCIGWSQQKTNNSKYLGGGRVLMAMSRPRMPAQGVLRQIRKRKRTVMEFASATSKGNETKTQKENAMPA